MRASLSVVLCLVASCGPREVDPAAVLIGLEIQPANATLTYTGTPVTLEYTAIGTYADGHTAELTEVTWSLDSDGTRLGAFADATFAANGQAAGKGGVFATIEDQVAATSVIVNVHPTRLGEGVPPDGASNFPDAPPVGAGSPTIVYPLDNAVMPTSVKSPNVQWEGPGTDGDLYRVRLVAGNATVDTILAVAPGFTFASQLTPEDWRLLVNSATTGITVTVDHWDPTNGANGGTPVKLALIPADVSGAIYYWNLNEGKMEKIDANGRSVAIPNPPANPNDGSRCIACHSVSKDGRYLSGSLWGGGLQGAVFDMSDPTITTADPAPTLAPVSTSSYTQLFSTFNPDASRLLINVGLTFSLIDPKTGQTVPSNGLPTGAVAHPAWSPDGQSVVFINNHNGPTWGVDYTSGDLAIMSATPGDAFGPATTLAPHSQDTNGYTAPSWPSFSPDSGFIAYGAGTHSRGDVSGTPHPGSLFVIDRDGGTSHVLDIACAGQRNCHLPNFSPYDAGGYFWLVFYSFRDYGNAQAGTKGTRRRQMWVTAIDKAKLASGQGDPSSVPYWLPDQDHLTNNMSAFWALPAPIF
ncbi:MAG TPA: hypothetical protein VM513_25205 [Kofleriaceae bacterium]|nr:hypothetical protein [Kofleriaceae bacterium]